MRWPAVFLLVASVLTGAACADEAYVFDAELEAVIAATNPAAEAWASDSASDIAAEQTPATVEIPVPAQAEPLPVDLPAWQAPSPYRAWVRLGARQWWTSGRYVPPLVTTSSNPGDDGILGRPTTTVLYGDETIDVASRSSVDVSLGVWRDPSRSGGVEVYIWDLGAAVKDYSVASSGSPLLARPYYDKQSGHLASLAFGGYDDTRGVAIDTRIREYVFMAGVDYRFNVFQRELQTEPLLRFREGHREILRELRRRRPRLQRLDLVVGYRHLRLEDSLWIREEAYGGDDSWSYIHLDGNVEETYENLVSVSSPWTWAQEDLFSSRNEFHGGEIGCVTEFCSGRWTLQLAAKLAIGNNQQTTRISGSTDFSHFLFGDGHANEGMFAATNNTGCHKRNRVSAIGDFGCELSCQLSQRWSAFVGYEFIYWPNVIRGADQIDAVSIEDLGRVPAFPNPGVVYRESDFFAQSVSVGGEFRF